MEHMLTVTLPGALTPLIIPKRYGLQSQHALYPIYSWLPDAGVTRGGEGSFESNLRPKCAVFASHTRMDVDS